MTSNRSDSFWQIGIIRFLIGGIGYVVIMLGCLLYLLVGASLLVAELFNSKPQVRKLAVRDMPRLLFEALKEAGLALAAIFSFSLRTRLVNGELT